MRRPAADQPARPGIERDGRDLRVFISNRDSRCDECHEDLGRHAMILLAGNRGACVSPARISTTSRSSLQATPHSRGAPASIRRSHGKIQVLGYRTNVAELRPGSSFMSTRPGTAAGPPELVTVDDLTAPVGTRDAVVPRGYLMRVELADIAAKLRAHHVRVTALDKPTQVEGEAFAIAQLRTLRSGGYEMAALDGSFGALERREYPAGSFYVDMAQPMANAAFYYLEPQARDGFVGWRVLDQHLRTALGSGLSGEYPLFKVRRVIQ